jgi:hypothetical protein
LFSLAAIVAPPLAVIGAPPLAVIGAPPLAVIGAIPLAVIGAIPLAGLTDLLYLWDREEEAGGGRGGKGEGCNLGGKIGGELVVSA